MSLKIIDEETREELAHIGMGVEEDVHACSDCRFARDTDRPSFMKCGARGGVCTEFVNSRGDCPHWRAKLPAVVPKTSKISIATSLSVTSLILSIINFMLALL